MPLDPDTLREFKEAWRKAYGEEITDDFAQTRFDEVLNLFVRMRELDRSLGIRPTYDRPQQVLLYIAAGDRLLTKTNLDEQPFSVQLPHGYAEEGETLHEAALRIADETEVGRCLLVAELGADERSVSDRTIDRHFYLVETASAARKRPWVVEQASGRVEYSWMKREHASDLADGLGDFLNQLPQAA